MMKGAAAAAVMVALTLVLATHVANAQDASAAYEVCAACHGADGAGNKDLNAPRIAGLPAWYTERQLQHFRAGVRGIDGKDVYGTQMRPMAATLADDAAVTAMAAYVEALEGAPAAASLEGDAEKGKTAYATCAACHGADGKGNATLNAPPLAGQADWYIVRQIDAFKKGWRGTHEQDTYGAQMRPMAMTLADEQAARDVAAYIATLP